MLFGKSALSVPPFILTIFLLFPCKKLGMHKTRFFDFWLWSWSCRGLDMFDLVLILIFGIINSLESCAPLQKAFANSIWYQIVKKSNKNTSLLKVLSCLKCFTVIKKHAVYYLQTMQSRRTRRFVW